MKKLITTFILGFVILLPLQPGLTTSVNASIEDDLITILEEELTLINKDITDIKKDVQEIKKMLKSLMKRKKPSIVTVSIDDDPFIGDRNAPVTLIEFSDYQCAFCGGFAKTILPSLKDEYIDKGKLKYVFRDFPLNIHKEAPKASEAAQCALDQGKYWEMHDAIFENQENMDIEDLKEYAGELGLDMDTFNSCLDNGKYTEEVSNDIKDGQKIGIKGTPSFIIGKSTPEGMIKGQLFVGSIPYAVFKTIIEANLKVKK